MRPFPETMVLVLGLLAAGAIMAYAQGVFEDLRLPLEHYHDGALKSELTAREAVVSVDGKLEATGVVIRFFKPDGAVESVIEAEACISDRAAQTASSESPVSFTRPNVRLTGVGFTWRAQEERLHIRSQARLVFNRDALAKERTQRDETDP